MVTSWCLVEILKQAQNDPYTVENQTAIIYARSNNLLKDIAVERVKGFEKSFLEELNKKHKKALNSLKQGNLTDDVIKTLDSVANQISKLFA